MPAEGGPHGWLVIDKPLGLGSARVVERIRRLAGVKVGHAGTLDPLATGVLPVALGEATKTAAYAMNGRKCYRFRIRWGVARSPTTGRARSSAKPRRGRSREAIEAVAAPLCRHDLAVAARLFGDQGRRAAAPMR